jgi:phytoene synthase
MPGFRVSNPFILNRASRLSIEIDGPSVWFIVQLDHSGSCDARQGRVLPEPRFAKELKIDPAEGALLARTIRAGSKSFDTASMLLPARYRLAARALYAFCRTSDDAVDEAAPGARATAALRARLEAIYDGRPGNSLEDRAFALVAQACQIPFEIPEALIQGFEWDEAGRRYEDHDALLDYAARVAGTVGVMMCLIMGRRERHILERAAELGLAMQLTNIARDVGEDARRGRIYLPLGWMRNAGIDPEAFLARPNMSPALASVIRRLLDEAGKLYASGFEGVPGLPAACRPAVRSAGLIYRAIGGRIEANGFDSVTQRARTGALHKLALTAMAMPAAVASSPVPHRRAHDSVQFLVEHAGKPPLAQTPDSAFGRFIDLLATLDARERRMTQTARAR